MSLNGSLTPAPGGTPALSWTSAEHTLLVQPWGADSVRVRAARHAVAHDLPGALLDGPERVAAQRVDDPDGSATLTVGALTVRLDAEGLLSFHRTGGGELLRERRGHFAWPGPRQFTPVDGHHHRLEQRFAAYEDERLYGLGQHTHGLLDHKHLVLDLVQRNGEVSIPFVLSSRGYGLLWNQPAVGRVEFAANGTRWVADAAEQLDYWVTTGEDPAALLAHYADATGHAPRLPAWALGLWQSKLRYRTQEELLSVVRAYHERGLPLSVVAVDYFHWRHQGDWSFDPADWPDPAAMVTELASLGVRPLLSVWPSVNALSENFAPMRERGLLVGTAQGQPFHHSFPDAGFGGRELPVAFYDPTEPRARAYVWERVRQNYYALGFRTWWLDACEPEIFPEQHAHLRYAAGEGRAVANLYPLAHVRGFWEHTQAENARHPGDAAHGEATVSLVRSAWAGSQRYGAALWSGDIPATFAALGAQIRAGLSAGLSGIPWWTTDIGGFHGGDPGDPAYRELLVRWFQFAVFCPLLRMHGHREPRGAFSAGHSGGANELWSYGEEAYAILRAQLGLRHRLAAYLAAHLEEAAETGLPLLRPLFLGFPADPRAWEAEDSFLCGPDLLVAPVTRLGAREREVYLPAGADWTDAASGETHPGGTTVTAKAPLERVPVFVRAGADPVLDAVRGT
ncbi:alpha-D-xyloside xylohydrolase [Streptomyces sp. TverLS-915]|uniref:glycoside hydrolase family 31 protein n=1 Tax=Streptomyces sp. TverLS-915 TaxID=1839763 RepID=UPI00081F11C4|nr:TIM-barrel domain-containing protein [Streptomyces sp. TverLS-915]SCD37628.1 alpha-D-xyloside xylohydrolase [Streptomyces sp. TverLS-915]